MTVTYRGEEKKLIKYGKGNRRSLTARRSRASAMPRKKLQQQILEIKKDVFSSNNFIWYLLYEIIVQRIGRNCRGNETKTGHFSPPKMSDYFDRVLISVLWLEIFSCFAYSLLIDIISKSLLSVSNSTLFRNSTREEISRRHA